MNRLKKNCVAYFRYPNISARSTYINFIIFKISLRLSEMKLLSSSGPYNPICNALDYPLIDRPYKDARRENDITSFATLRVFPKINTCTLGFRWRLV